MVQQSLRSAGPKLKYVWWRLMDFLAAIFIAPLVFLIGYCLVRTFIEHRWYSFGATVLVGAVVSSFAFIVIRDCIDRYGETED
jgi:membrane protein DedA with SNARE-associated domain